MLGFRDWLRAEGDRLYERRKRELTAKTWRYVQIFRELRPKEPKLVEISNVH